MTAEASSDSAGTQARNTPLSVTVVSRIPTVSPMKYRHGQNSATRSSGQSRLPLSRILTSPSATHRLITASATINRQPSSARALAASAVRLVNR